MARPRLGTFVEQLRRLIGPRPAPDHSDGQLLERLADGRDESALDTLVRRHAGLVWGVCRRLLADPNDAEDAFQATFVVLVRKAKGLDRRGSLAGWLHGVAYRVAVRARVNAVRRATYERQARPMPTSAPPGEPGRDELRRVLDEELNRLPEKYRLPLVLCHLEGKTNEEAAALLRWPVGTVKGRAARAREALRRRLERRGLALSAAAMAGRLAEEAALAAPTELLAATVQTGLRVATGAGAPTSISILAEGVIHTMFVTKLKMAALLLLAVGVAVAGAGVLRHQVRASGDSAIAAVPGDDPAPKTGELAKEDKGKTDPAGVPLELKLVAKKGSYALDLGGRTPDEYRKEVEKEGGPRLAAPEVDLELELTNTGKEELKLWQVGQGIGIKGDDLIGLAWDLKGPGALSHSRTVGVNTVIQPRKVWSLAAGKSRTFAVKNLSAIVSRVQGSEVSFQSVYWNQAGEYTLTARFLLGVSPAPKDAETASGEYGYVTVTSAPVKLKVEAKE
jgi:RNA polymerase sigma factor (sigma-70 family)